MHVRTPGHDAQVDQVASILLALETAPAQSLRLTPLAVRRPDGEFAFVSCRLGGAVTGLSIEDARLVAYSLVREQPYAGCEAIAKAFTDAAFQAERQLGSCQAAAPLGFGFRPVLDQPLRLVGGQA